MVSQNSTAPRAPRPRILLVEDDAGVRRSLQLLLQARGFDVRAHATGATLLADPSAAEAACIVTDYRMNDLDGMEVLSMLRQRGWHGPAVLITAFPSTELSRRAETEGFSAVIEKPFRDQLLADTITRLVGT